MYKLLLCWRYLRTRYLAMLCIISVMLGVATLIVVNSVMAGFSTKLRDRLHGLLSDVLVEAIDFDGFPDADQKIRAIQDSPIGPYIEALSPTVEVFAMLQFRVMTPYRDATVTKPIRLIGVDPATRSRIGGFSEFLASKNDSGQLQPTPPQFKLTGEARRRMEASRLPAMPEMAPMGQPDPTQPPPPEPWERTAKEPPGAIVGFALATFRHREEDGASKDVYLLEPGDEMLITTISSTVGSKGIMPVQDRFYLTGYFRSEMSEYDSNYVFVPLDYLQHLRTMEGRVTSIQIKLKDYANAPVVTEQLRRMFPGNNYQVHTWEEKQGTLLAAISIERGILNVLLFMIVGVAGFGILAIFSMIVVEKTRDIGILKSLGASNRGVMSIFLGYGLLLGAVGSIMGTVLGLTITQHLNEIERFLTRITGQEIFDRTVYYFDSIPTFVQPSSVLLVNLGAIAIAVAFSILPALRAAMLHPVRALRFE